MRRTTPDGTPVPDFIPYFPERRSKRGWTPDVQRLFIGLLTATGSARASARAVERSLRSAYQLRARHGAESFAAAWTEAAARGHEVARLEALVRATQSLDRPGQDDRDDRLALALIGTRDSGDAAFSEQRYRLE